MIRTRRQITMSALVFGLAWLLLMATYIYSTLNFTRTDDSVVLVAHTYHVKELIERLSSNVRDAERVERGYLLTNDPHYLTAYHAAIRDQRLTLNALRALTRDNPVQIANLNQLERLVLQRLAMLQKVITTQQQDGLNAAIALIRTGNGMRLMDAVQDQVQRTMQEEDRLLALRQQRVTQYRQELYFSFLAFVLALVVVVSGYLLMQMSVFHQRKLLAELNKYAEQLEHSNQELALVATIASHDLKAPLRKIHFFVGEILKDPVSRFSEESRDFFKRIQASAEKMQQLTEHVLAIAVGKGSDFPMDSVNLRQLTKEVTETLEKQILETQGQVEVGAMCSIHADKYEMAQLLQNLIENALKYHQPGLPPKVSVSAMKTDDGGCEIRVRDNGIGVALGTVARIVQHHHGAVRVESAPGEGSEFIVQLPALSPGLSKTSV